MFYRAFDWLSYRVTAQVNSGKYESLSRSWAYTFRVHCNCIGMETTRIQRDHTTACLGKGVRLSSAKTVTPFVSGMKYSRNFWQVIHNICIQIILIVPQIPLTSPKFRDTITLSSVWGGTRSIGITHPKRGCATGWKRTGSCVGVPPVDRSACARYSAINEAPSRVEPRMISFAPTTS